MILEGKGSFFILLFIVAFLSLSLAVLAGYVFFIGNNSTSKPTTTEAADTAKKIPEAQLASITLFDKKYFNLKSTDPAKLSVLSVGMKLTVYKGAKGTEETAKTALEPYMSKMKDYASTYFSKITIDEARDQEVTKEKAKTDLLAKFNQIVPPEEKTKQKLIIEIDFEDWFAQ